MTQGNLFGEEESNVIPIGVETIFCTKCQRQRPITGGSHRWGIDKRRGHCRDCRNANIRKWRHLKVHGITPEEWQEMWDAQGGSCSICDVAFDGFRKVHLDHDHRTGWVRGLLCSQCNTGLGMFKDDLLLLKSAMEYLSDSIDEQIEEEDGYVPPWEELA